MQTEVRPRVTPTPGVRPPRTGAIRRADHRVLAGALLSITGIGIILSIITNEALYPASRHYSTFGNTISDLSGTEPPGSYVVQPNRLIFIVTMAVSGLLVLAATYLLWQVVTRRRFLVSLAALGVGLVGIAIFPGNVATYHPILALLCFVGGSVAAILSWSVIGGPARYLSVVLGWIALLATVLGLDPLATWWPQTAIGVGGIERWIAYPVLLWLVLLGGTLMAQGREQDGRSTRSEPAP
jgi:hypothetical membrane protein